MTFKTADLCDEHEGRVQVLLPGLRSYGGKPRFHGEIVTIRALGDYSQVREQVNQAGTGKVLVVDNAAAMHCAVLGDLLAAAALKNGWALASVPARGDKAGRGDVNVDVAFLGALFRPGEYLYSDEDGTLLSPRALF